MGPDEPIPEKLLDSPELDISWPAGGFTCAVAEVIRLDYTSQLHSPEWQPFFHDFDSAVTAHEPAGDGAEEGDVPQAVQPIFFGLADRLYLRVDDMLVGMFPWGEAPEDGPDVDVVLELRDSFVAWDPEHKSLIFIDEALEPWLVLRDGDLWIDSESMIGG